MAKRIRCHCNGWAGCKLCHGTGYYEYAPGPLGWQPFRCPTCNGEKSVDVPGEGPKPCPTCAGTGSVDPAQPPGGGWLDTIFKIFFGA